MGQYQQWLRCQELDQRLKAQQDELEAELLAVHERAHFLAQSIPSMDNLIVQALAIALDREQLATTSSNGRSADATSGAWEPALLLQQMLPPVQSVEHSNPPSQAPVTQSPPFISEQGVLIPAEPQVELPAWLHNLTIASGKDLHMGPIDQESVRTNRLVKRWLERWGRVSSELETSMEEQAHE